MRMLETKVDNKIFRKRMIKSNTKIIELKKGLPNYRMRDRCSKKKLKKNG